MKHAKRVAALAAIALTLAGCGGPSEPDLQSPALVQARAGTESSIDELYEKLDLPPGLAQYASGTLNTCIEGRNNWKVHDGFHYRCEHTVVRYYGFDGTLRDQLLAVEQRVTAAGWGPNYSRSASEPIREMFDRCDHPYTGPTNSSATSTSTTTTTATNAASAIPRCATPNSDIRYRQPDAGEPSYELQLAWADARTTDSDVDHIGYPITDTRHIPYFKESNLPETAAVLRTVTAEHRYMLAVFMESVYFRN